MEVSEESLQGLAIEIGSLKVNLALANDRANAEKKRADELEAKLNGTGTVEATATEVAATN